MKRAVAILAGLLVAAIALPPLWFAVFPGEPAPDLPPPGRRIELADGTGLNVLITGQGPPAVLIHGLPGSAYDWRDTLPELAQRGMEAIAYDRVGYGRSDARGESPYVVASNADELLGLLEAMALRDVTVVGWSYGGATAMTAAMSGDPRAARIARLVLVGTGGPDSDDAEMPEASALMRFFYSDGVLRWRTAIPPLGTALMRALSAQAFSDGPQPDWWIEGLRANFSRWETLVTFREEMFGMTPESVAGFDPGRIRVPTLLLHGDDDRLADVGISRYLVERIPDAELVECAGASHMLPVTHPVRLAERIVDFAREGP